MTAAIKNNGGSQFDILIGGVAVATIDSTGIVGVKDASITAAKLAASAITTAKLDNTLLPVGPGQTRQSLTGSRTLGVTYTNSTGRPIRVMAYTSISPGATSNLSIVENGTTQTNIYQSIGGAQVSIPIWWDIAAGSTYTISGSGLGDWVEIR